MVHPIAFSRFASTTEEDHSLDGHDMLACRETILGRNLVQCALKRRMHVWVETHADGDHSPIELRSRVAKFSTLQIAPKPWAEALIKEAMRAAP